MKTYIVQIGNSDDKLTQDQWAFFVQEVTRCIQQWCYKLHFYGFSNPDSRWQNACWVFECHDIDELKDYLISIRQKYRQESIALTIGNTEFV